MNKRRRRSTLTRWRRVSVHRVVSFAPGGENQRPFGQSSQGAARAAGGGGASRRRRVSAEQVTSKEPRRRGGEGGIEYIYIYGQTV